MARKPKRKRPPPASYAIQVLRREAGEARRHVRLDVHTVRLHRTAVSNSKKPTAKQLKNLEHWTACLQASREMLNDLRKALIALGDS
jgi:exonuclease III